MGLHDLSTASKRRGGGCLALVAAALLFGSVAGTVADDDGALFQATSKRRFDDVEHWTKVFDDPERDAWQRPAEVVEKLRLNEGMRVADLGAGTGYFSRRLAQAVGPSGTVYAVETEPALVAHLRERAEREGSANLVPILASFDNPRLPRGAVDVLLIVDTYHHIDARLTYFERVKALLAPNGRVAIIDWKKKELPVGPALDHKLAREQVVEEMKRAGYALTEESRDLPHQYFLIFTNPAQPER